MPTASKAFQAFVHVVKANPVTLKLSEDSNTKLRIPNLHKYLRCYCVGLDLLIYLNHWDLSFEKVIILTNWV